MRSDLARDSELAEPAARAPRRVGAHERLAGTVGPADRPPPTRVEDEPPLGMDLVKSGIKTIVWASGYRPDYSWLKLPVLDRKGYVTHDGGVVSAPGVYLMGMQFLRRRKSALIDGAGDDARDLSAHLAACLAGWNCQLHPLTIELGDNATWIRRRILQPEDPEIVEVDLREHRREIRVEKGQAA
jgi:hypothetical protein